jgi:hypothetical protein
LRAGSRARRPAWVAATQVLPAVTLTIASVDQRGRIGEL